MARCLLNAPINSNECSFSIGGLSKIYIANYDDVISYTDSDLDGIIDTITMGTSGTARFYEFDISKNTSSANSVLTVNGGNKYILQTVDFFINKDDAESIDIAEVLSLGNFVVITKNRKGKYKIYGNLDGLEATAGDVNSGVAEGDTSTIHMTLSGPSENYFLTFDGVIPV